MLYKAESSCTRQICTQTNYHLISFLDHNDSVSLFEDNKKDNNIKRDKNPDINIVINNIRNTNLSEEGENFLRSQGIESSSSGTLNLQKQLILTNPQKSTTIIVMESNKSICIDKLAYVLKIVLDRNEVEVFILLINNLQSKEMFFTLTLPKLSQSLIVLQPRLYPEYAKQYENEISLGTEVFNTQKEFADFLSNEENWNFATTSLQKIHKSWVTKSIPAPVQASLAVCSTTSTNNQFKYMWLVEALRVIRKRNHWLISEITKELQTLISSVNTEEITTILVRGLQALYFSYNEKNILVDEEDLAVQKCFERFHDCFQEHVLYLIHKCNFAEAERIVNVYIRYRTCLPNLRYFKLEFRPNERALTNYMLQELIYTAQCDPSDEKYFWKMSGVASLSRMMEKLLVFSTPPGVKIALNPAAMNASFGLVSIVTILYKQQSQMIRIIPSNLASFKDQLNQLIPLKEKQSELCIIETLSPRAISQIEKLIFRYIDALVRFKAIKVGNPIIIKRPLSSVMQLLNNSLYQAIFQLIKKHSELKVAKKGISNL